MNTAVCIEVKQLIFDRVQELGSPSLIVLMVSVPSAFLVGFVQSSFP